MGEDNRPDCYQDDTPLPLLPAVVSHSRKRAFNLFAATHGLQLPEHPPSQRLRVAAKVLDDYKRVAAPPPPRTALPPLPSTGGASQLLLADGHVGAPPLPAPLPLLPEALQSGEPHAAGAGAPSAAALAAQGAGATGAVQDVATALALRAAPQGVSEESRSAFEAAAAVAALAQAQSRAVALRRAPPKVPEPRHHAQWKLRRVISGHMGWVRSIAVDPSNEWFATGAADRTIKIWDLASGTLKLTLTGHINAVRGLAVSHRQPYLFSCGEDKMVKCWDLETNKVIRAYDAHLSGVYALALHPTLDVLFTGGRDSSCRVWDMRTRANIHVLTGHEGSVSSIIANSTDPQVITGAMDNTVRLWDIAAGKVRTVLTHHKKAVRALVGHSREFAFVSGAADNLKKWALPDGVFVSNLSGHNSIINTLALNDEDVLVSGGDDGSLKFWDYASGTSFQELQSRVQPGSLDAEAGIYASVFDQTGSRLITGEADKTIKIWAEAAEGEE